MVAPAKLKLFVDKILSISVQRMGGAFAGIMGVSGADNQILTKLKRTAVAYANEYIKSSPDRTELDKLSGDIYGYLQTLQLTYTLTENEATILIDELQILDTDLT
jgi:hypothetical protein